MKRLLPSLFLLAILMADASAQVKFEYYNTEDNYFLLSLPTGSVMLTRFDAVAPVRITEISAWFVSRSTGGKMDLVMYGREGGYMFPYQMKPLFTPVPVDIPAGKDSLFRFQLQTPVVIGQPGQFFVGIIKRSDSVSVRMDRITQMIPCSNAENDSLFTNSFAIYNPASMQFNFGAWFSNRMPVNNWYIGAAGEYFNDSPTTLFTDITVDAGLNVPFSSNRRVAWGDFNNDGFQDLLWGDYLFRNRGDGTFEEVSKSMGYTAGSSVQMFADIDNDGDLDIICQPANLVYINNAGSSFTLRPNTGFGQSVNTQAMSFADYNNDKFPDLFVANGEYIYKKNPANPSDSALVEGAAWQGHLYTNSNGTSFTDNTANLAGYQKGPYGTNPYNQNETVEGYRPSTCAQWVDYDNDGDMDLFIGNDRLQMNYLFENRGTPTFGSVASAHGAQGGSKPSGTYGSTRGCDFGDYNLDGSMDLLTGEMALPYQLSQSDVTSVWKNDPALSYNFRLQTSAKLGYLVYQADVAWGDFNNDGLLDFVVTSGQRCFNSTLYMQNSDNSFTDVTWASGTALDNSFGTAWGDYDNDGDLDLAIIGDAGLRLFRNDTPGKGNWVELNLQSKTGNASAIGARVRVYAGGNIYTRQVMAGKGAGSQEPYVQHIGLGTAVAIDSVLIRWPGKKTQETLKNVEINKLNTIVEKTGPSAVTDETAPKNIDLQQNFPNPFSKSRYASTSIAYNLPSSGDILLEIYDLNGARVKVLVNKSQSPGLHYAQWDGRNDNGTQVASGTYVYLLLSNGAVLTRQMIVLK